MILEILPQTKHRTVDEVALTFEVSQIFFIYCKQTPVGPQ